jgi:hypothetical protein
MDQMGNIGEGLQSYFRAVKRTPSGGPSRLQLFRATFFALSLGFVRILAAAWLVENALDRGR